ncbi:hypothetical protein C8R45DRAFT_1221158 [Mycena sanguinolenta]|nr:hypothetical protein C8R45DRAFT_1221158 [Mycena sanguinolenta]
MLDTTPRYLRTRSTSGARRRANDMLVPPLGSSHPRCRRLRHSVELPARPTPPLDAQLEHPSRIRRRFRSRTRGGGRTTLYRIRLDDRSVSFAFKRSLLRPDPFDQRRCDHGLYSHSDSAPPPRVGPQGATATAARAHRKDVVLLLLILRLIDPQTQRDTTRSRWATPVMFRIPEIVTTKRGILDLDLVDDQATARPPRGRAPRPRYPRRVVVTTLSKLILWGGVMHVDGTRFRDSPPSRSSSSLLHGQGRGRGDARAAASAAVTFCPHQALRFFVPALRSSTTVTTPARLCALRLSLESFPQASPSALEFGSDAASALSWARSRSPTAADLPSVLRMGVGSRAAIPEVPPFRPHSGDSTSSTVLTPALRSRSRAARDGHIRRRSSMKPRYAAPQPLLTLLLSVGFGAVLHPLASPLA